jgi:hypothetical protein
MNREFAGSLVPSFAIDYSLALLNLAVAEIAFVSPVIGKVAALISNVQRSTGRTVAIHRRIGVYLVTGSYTFVRDRRPTLAGLRGSRPAELITTLGALNQLDESVTAKFAPR